MTCGGERSGNRAEHFYELRHATIPRAANRAAREWRLTKTPEELELDSRRIELEGLGAILAQAEVDLATLQVELAAFEQEYRRTVGLALAELDAIHATIATVEAARQPKSSSHAQAAREASRRAAESAAATAGDQSAPIKEPHRTEDLKTLFRDAAKKLHPDLTTDEAQRRTRTEWMARVNAAYEEADGEALRAIVEEWQFAPDAIQGDDVASNLVRVIRSIAQVKRRLSAIAEERAKLHGCDLYLLWEAVQVAVSKQRDLLGELRASVERQLAAARAQLSALEGTA